MDIIDIMLAKALTPQGQTDLYVNKANKAAAKAAKAEEDAAAAVATVEAAASTISETQEAAGTLLATAQEALETAQAAQINTLDIEDVDTEVKKMTVNTNTVTGSSVNTLQVITTYPDNTLNTQNITKLYKNTGNNEDGGMTQKAISDALGLKADASTAATKQYVDSAIANIPANSNNATINFNTEDSGHIVVIDEEGNAAASDITENELIEAMIRTGAYNARNAVGLEINYANKLFIRIQDAANLTMGTDFNTYPMYGGRMRCNVADNGTINAFYGDQGYTEDGSNGQVMVYQPKFYYQRTPLTIENMASGQIIRKETILISAVKQSGFKIAPIFMTPTGEELDYVLFSAYDGSIVNDKMASIANSKPAANITITQAETYATNRGTGWHITNMAAESANQMLEIVEFGSMNGQEILGKGISNITPINDVNCASLTGSTASLGNSSGAASSTTNESNGTTTQQTDSDKVAISYRGVENPWGNIWHMIGGVNISGNGAQQGGIAYICTDFNYTPGTIGSNYESVGFSIPSVYNWISAMGYGSSAYDWVFLPAECSSSATSLLPVGDNLWTVANLRDVRICAVGGSYNLQANNGPFYYAADRLPEESSRNNYGARLMYIPTKNATYTSNINKWLAKIGG